MGELKKAWEEKAREERRKREEGGIMRIGFEFEPDHMGEFAGSTEETKRFDVAMCGRMDDATKWR